MTTSGRKTFAPGQVWTFRDARLPSSRVVVGRVDATPVDTAIVSVSVTDALLPDPETGALVPRIVQHAPMGSEALAASVIEPVGQGAVPEGFDEGYGIWRRAFDEGRAGFFTCSVAELEDFFRTALAPRRENPH